jgi:Cu/Ag efflux protein CusF
VTLDHEDIPGFMKAMTMTFTLAPDVALDGIDPGAKVDFRVKEEGGVYTVTAIRGSGS